MDRYTEKTKCCFKYDIKGFEHKIKEFNDYDAFYAYSIAVMKLGEYEDTELTPEQVESLKAENERLKMDCAACQDSLINAEMNLEQVVALKEENERLKAIISNIPFDRLEEICKAEKEDRIIILPKCPNCGLVNSWVVGKRNCDRCGALLYEQAEAALKESEDKHYKSLNMDILKSKPSKIVSTEEALRDVEPLFTELPSNKIVVEVDK